MQNAPFEYGCSGFGAMSVTRPFSTVTRVPQHTEHSQQVLAKICAAAGAGVASAAPLN
jgi:hypothetical protein